MTAAPPPAPPATARSGGAAACEVEPMTWEQRLELLLAPRLLPGADPADLLPAAPPPKIGAR